MKQVKLSEVKNGDYIKRKSDSRQVWIKIDYCREAKKYILVNTDDIGHSMLMKGSTLVFLDFEY